MPSLTIEPVAHELRDVLRDVRRHINAAQDQARIIRDEPLGRGVPDAAARLQWALEAANRATWPGLQELWDAQNTILEEWE